MYACDSWTTKEAELRRIDAFELWCWRRLLRVPWTARRSNQSILKARCPRQNFTHRRRPTGLSQPSAPCERTDIRAGKGNLANVMRLPPLAVCTKNGVDKGVWGHCAYTLPDRGGDSSRLGRIVNKIHRGLGPFAPERCRKPTHRYRHVRRNRDRHLALGKYDL